MATELSIKTKTRDMMKYGYLALAQFPKSEKFALGVDIKHSMHTILRLTTAASKKYHKKTTLQDLDIEISVLQDFVRLAYDQKFIDPKKYEVWSGYLVELGKMLGGWMKSVQHR